MAITEAFSGTEAVSTAEHSMTTDTDAVSVETSDGIFQAFLDVNDMIAGDELQFRVYEKCRSGDTQRIMYQANLVGAQAQPIWVSPTWILLHGWDMTLDCIAGTNITVLWSIRKVG
jgi:hypothetical protein